MKLLATRVDPECDWAIEGKEYEIIEELTHIGRKYSDTGAGFVIKDEEGRQIIAQVGLKRNPDVQEYVEWKIVQES